MAVFQVDDRRRLRQQRLQVCRRARRDQHGEDHTRQRGVEPRLVKDEPEHDAADGVRQRAVHARAVEHDQQTGHRAAGNQVRRVDLAGIEQRDDHDRHDVVDDDRRRQEHAQLDGNAIAE